MFCGFAGWEFLASECLLMLLICAFYDGAFLRFCSWFWRCLRFMLFCGFVLRVCVSGLHTTSFGTLAF